VVIEVLSNHPGHELSRVDSKIEAQHRNIEAHRAAYEDLRARQTASRRWWQFRVRAAHRDELRSFELAAPVIDEQLEVRRAQLVAGIAGEEQMTAALHHLSDEWRLFRGYENRRGEVDHLLVGPRGVWAIEVKCSGVRVHIKGDHWSFEKFDRYGNLCGAARSWTAADVAGDVRYPRSPANSSVFWPPERSL
jgi:ribosomal protein L20